MKRDMVNREGVTEARPGTRTAGVGPRKRHSVSSAGKLLVCLLALVTPLSPGQRDEKRERRQREKIESLSEKLGRRFAYSEPTEEQLYLHAQAASLIEQVKKSRSDHYRFDRLARATDALLEASEEMLEARRETPGKDEHDQRETALELQEDYFRVQQADYFARQWNQAEANEYAKHARSLYQQARRAYDKGEYDKAEGFGDAASYVVRALENLAQAAIRIPEPPRIP